MQRFPRLNQQRHGSGQAEYSERYAVGPAAGLLEGFHRPRSEPIPKVMTPISAERMPLRLLTIRLADNALTFPVGP